MVPPRYCYGTATVLYYCGTTTLGLRRPTGVDQDEEEEKEEEEVEEEEEEDGTVLLRHYYPRTAATYRG